jgi:flagellar hook-associated protein 3 FlgL
MMVSAAGIGAQWFLNGTSNLQNEILKTSNALSSGYQVNSAADAPGQTTALVDLGSQLGTLQTYQTNLTGVQNEAQTADQTLGTAISLVQNAQSIGVQATGLTITPAQMQNMASQIQGIQQQMVSLANTTVAGRYIFGGDQSTSAPYQYDATSTTNGVDQLTTQTATYAFTNPSGQTVYQPLTATQVFDNQDSSGTPTANNVFVALQSLSTALQNNDTTGVENALSSLDTASDWLNQEQGYYGTTEQRITTEQNTVANQITSVETSIGAIRDTDMVKAATDLTQESAAQSAAYEAQSAISQKSLFDYLG